MTASGSARPPAPDLSCDVVHSVAVKFGNEQIGNIGLGVLTDFCRDVLAAHHQGKGLDATEYEFEAARVKGSRSDTVMHCLLRIERLLILHLPTP